MFNSSVSLSINAEHGKDAEWSENNSGGGKRHQSYGQIKLLRERAPCYGQIEVSGLRIPMLCYQGLCDFTFGSFYRHPTKKEPRCKHWGVISATTEEKFSASDTIIEYLQAYEGQERRGTTPTACGSGLRYLSRTWG